MVRWTHRTRHFLGRVAHALPGDFYGRYELGAAEFVGTIDAQLDEAIATIRETDYSYNLVAATKQHPEPGRVDDGSYRRIDPNGRDRQWHAHLFERADDGESRVEVFSHYEYRPLWPPSLSRTREHYRPEWGETYLLGQHCEVLKDVLETHGEYDGDDAKLGSASLPAP